MAEIRRLATARLVLCDPPRSVCDRRLQERRSRDPGHGYFHGEARPTGNWRSPDLDVPTLRVDTTDGYAPPREEIRDFARS